MRTEARFKRGDSIRIFVAAGFGLMVCLACTRVGAGHDASSSASVQHEKPAAATGSGTGEAAHRVVLRLGEERILGDLTLTWTEVDDSRCPTGVNCIWEGRAVVTLEISVGEKDPQTVRLTNDPDGLREEEDSDLAERLRLVDVEPYPHSEHPIERSDYRAVIQIKDPSWDSTPTAIADISGDFRLQRVDAQTWRAEYCYTQAVEAIRFERPFEGLRQNSWRVESDALELTHGEGSAELRRVDGEPIRCATIELAPYTERPEKNYYAFSPFSDGGMSVYTGYLTGPVLVEGEWREVGMAASYVGLDGERVITREPDRLAQQFVYFGRQQVVDSDGVIAVIDPAMPAEARHNILQTIPAVNELLAREFGFRPASPYMVFMAADPDAFDGYSVKGGTQFNQILFTLKGREVVALIEKDPAHFPKLAAHEAIHLWQEEHWFQSLDDGHPWLHEGSADALAFEILRRIGIYDREQYEHVWQTTEDRCLDFLAETSVLDAPEAGMFDAVYACGALVNRLVGEALNPDDPGVGVIRLWRAMSDCPEAERRSSGEALFFRTLEALGFSQAQIGALQDFTSTSADSPARALAALRRSLQVAPGNESSG